MAIPIFNLAIYYFQSSTSSGFYSAVTLPPFWGRPFPIFSCLPPYSYLCFLSGFSFFFLFYPLLSSLPPFISSPPSFSSSPLWSPTLSPLFCIPLLRIPLGLWCFPPLCLQWVQNISLFGCRVLGGNRRGSQGKVSDLVRVLQSQQRPLRISAA